MRKFFKKLNKRNKSYYKMKKKKKENKERGGQLKCRGKQKSKIGFLLPKDHMRLLLDLSPFSRKILKMTCKEVG